MFDINLFTSRGDGNSAMSPEMMKSSTDINLYTSRGDGNLFAIFIAVFITLRYKPIYLERGRKHNMLDSHDLTE